MTKYDLIQYLNDVAKLYKVKVKWTEDNTGGSWTPLTNQIRVSINEKNSVIASVFFHELSHYLNYIDGDFPSYHRTENFASTLKKQGYGIYSTANYALKAEIYTDKRAKKLMKQFLPKHKFIGWYKNTEYFQGFILGMIINDYTY